MKQKMNGGLDRTFLTNKEGQNRTEVSEGVQSEL